MKNIKEILEEEDFPLVCPPMKQSSLEEGQIRQHLIENWVDELLHFYSEYFQDRDFYFHTDYQLLEAILDSTLTNPFYKGQPSLETFLKNIKACFLGRELPSPTPELVASFNENFKNEPNFS